MTWGLTGMMVEQPTGENRRKGAFGIITGVHGKLLSCEGPGPGDRWPHSRDSRGWGTRPICKQCCGVISARRQAIHGRGGELLRFGMVPSGIGPADITVSPAATRCPLTITKLL